MSHALTFADKEFIVAVHEAGHAVACVKLEVPFISVSIDRSSRGSGAGVASEAHACPDLEVGDGGHAAPEGSGDRGSSLAAYAKRCRNQVIVCFAGRIAEEHAVRFRLTNGVGIDSDRKDLRDARFFVRELVRTQEAVRCIDGEAVLAKPDFEALPARLVSEMTGLRAEAEKLVVSHFQCIETLARILVVRKQLNAVEVVRLIAVVGRAPG